MNHLITERKQFWIAGNYGIKFLDDMLLGIHKEDFVLIGADTGVGKTEFVYDIAFRNAAKGVKVHLFALEAEQNEPYYRKLYKIISKKYFNEVPYCKKINMNYRNYITNKIDVDDYEKDAISELDKYYNLTVHYRVSEDWYSFTLNNLLSLVTEAYSKGDCDMVIIDHVDYFDLNSGENENQQITEIMQSLRMLNQNYKLPIIVVSHLRKRNSKQQLIPTIDDFMGSSNKAKQVKTVILLSRDNENSKPEEGIYSTFFTCPKSRIGGGDPWVAAAIDYDRKKNSYCDAYTLYKIKNFGESVEFLPKEKHPLYLKDSGGLIS